MSRVHEGPEPSDSPELAKYREETERSVNQFFNQFTLVLKAHKIVEVQITYGAGEDDGGIEDITYFHRVDGKLVQYDGEVKMPSRSTMWGEESQFESFFYDLMSKRGFFNQNEGCQGLFRWSVENDMLIHDHQSNTYGDDGEIANPDEPKEDQYKETTYIPGEVETYWGIDDVRNG